MIFCSIAAMLFYAASCKNLFKTTWCHLHFWSCTFIITHGIVNAKRNWALSSRATWNIFQAIAIQCVALLAREKNCKWSHIVSKRFWLLATYTNVAAIMQQNQVILILLQWCNNKNMFLQQNSVWFRRDPLSATHFL